MSEPIKKGDLVMVVRWPCCGVVLGRIGVVRSFGVFDLSDCAHCGKETGVKGVRFARIEGRDSLWPLPWVKRIPPYNQLEHFRTEELLRRDVKEKA